MSNLTEEQRIKKIIKAFKNRYPRAVTLGKDKNLVGEFLEVLTRQAFSYNGLKIVDWASQPGDRGIDATVMCDSFFRPLFLAIECMNGRYDYTPKYFKHLKTRISQACSKQQYPLIICVDKKKNFQRFHGKFACNVEFIELGKQFHPNTTTFTDYEMLKKQVWGTINKIAWAERPQEMAEWKQRKHEKQHLGEEKKALEALDENRLKEIEQSEDFEETQGEDPIIVWEDDE